MGKAFSCSVVKTNKINIENQIHAARRNKTCFKYQKEVQEMQHHYISAQLIETSYTAHLKQHCKNILFNTSMLMI